MKQFWFVQNFGNYHQTTWYHNPEGNNISTSSSALKMEIAGSFQMLVPINQATGQHILEDYIHVLSSKNLKFHVVSRYIFIKK
jgi:hypothetical protein